MTCIAPADDGTGRSCPDPRLPGSLFCRAHELAPAARRGGWLSAERRRRRLAADHALDATSVTPRPALKLWVGGPPPADRDLPGFDVIVLCAEEHQVPLPLFHGRVIRCPLRDDVIDTPRTHAALSAAVSVARALRAGQRVLVTCHAGLNRAALVAALALARITRMTADEIVQTMKLRRHPLALSNPSFVRLIQLAARR